MSVAANPLASPGRLRGIALALALATVAVLVNGLPGAFVFDDVPSIPGNPTLRSLWPLSGPLSPPRGGETVTARPVLNLSFALNRALSGDAPAGFRAVNIALHVASGCLLLGIAWRLAVRAGLGASRAHLVAAVAAGLWLLHPLQTAAVTYIVQRAESLMAFFYLLTVYAFLRAVDGRRAQLWLSVSWSACALGMATKEVMVSAPIVVFACDALFVAKGWRAIPRRRWVYHAALATTWILLAGLVWSAGGNRGGTSAAGAFSTGQYWLAQTDALLRYVKLAVWPTPLVFDYGIEPPRPVLSYLLPIVLLIAAMGLTVRALLRGKAGGMIGLVFFLVLAPTSLVPGARQFMAEHRMYLALAPLVIAGAVLMQSAVGRRAWPILLAAAVGLGALTARRNLDYRSGLALWSDTVAKQPTNGWARVNLASALAERGELRRAEAQLDIVLQQNPDHAMARFNLGSVLLELGRPAEAIAHFTRALELQPDYSAARNNLADALGRAGRHAEAAAQYAQIVARGHDAPEIRYNWGNALFRSGQVAEAQAQLHAALQQRPDYADASFNLGAIELEQGDFAAAAARFEHVLRIRPVDADAHTSLAAALAQLGRHDEALSHGREAVRLAPRGVAARANLGTIYALMGRRAEAIAELSEALRLAPDHTAARQLLQQLRRN